MGGLAFGKVLVIVVCWPGFLNLAGSNFWIDFPCTARPTLYASDLIPYENVTQLRIHCGITDISKNAFNGLQLIRWLDLSDNNLVYINPETFSNMKSLSYLILNGNTRLSQLTDRYFVLSKSVRQLHIRGTKLICMNDPNLPNLEIFTDKGLCPKNAWNTSNGAGETSAGSDGIPVASQDLGDEVENSTIGRFIYNSTTSIAVDVEVTSDKYIAGGTSSRSDEDSATRRLDNLTPSTDVDVEITSENSMNVTCKSLNPVTWTIFCGVVVAIAVFAVLGFCIYLMLHLHFRNQETVTKFDGV